MYQRLYSLLFNAITDALELLTHGEIAAAANVLINAQKQSEELYIETEETKSAGR